MQFGLSNTCFGLEPLIINATETIAAAIDYVEAHPDNADVQALLDEGFKDPGLVDRVVAAVRASGAVDNALHEARKLIAQSQRSLESLPDSVYARSLSSLARYVVDRDL